MIPYGLQGELAVLFVVFGLAVAGARPRASPAVVRWLVHAAAGASVLVLYVVLALGVAPVLWILNASDGAGRPHLIALPWLSRRMAALDTDTIRVRLAISLFTGSLVPLLSPYRSSSRCATRPERWRTPRSRRRSA